MPILRKEKNKKYTTVDNYFIDDKKLDPEGKGYLLYMLRKPNDWSFSYKSIENDLNVGERNVRTNMKKLEKLHYLKRTCTRGKKGEYEWNYYVYEIPYDLELKIDNYPYVRNAHVDTVDILLNNNNTKDKIDKTKSEDFEHNIFTLKLINYGFIKEDDYSSFLFDELFNQYLADGYSVRELMMSIYYIIPRIIANNYLDENGNEIVNKYGYFKNAIESNFNKLNNLGKDLYSQEEIENTLKEIEGR